MPARKLYIEFDESVAQGAAVAARHSGMSLSDWINAAARHVLEDGYFELDGSDAADDGAVDIEEEVVDAVFVDNAFLDIDLTAVAAGDTTGSDGELDTIEIESWLDVDGDGGGGPPPADDEHQLDDQPTDDQPTPVLDEEELVWADADDDARAPGDVGTDVAASDEAVSDAAAGDEAEDNAAEADDISQLELLFAGEPEPAPQVDAPATDES